MPEPLSDDTLEALRFPTGRFQVPETPLESDVRIGMIDAIARTPAALAAAVEGLSDEQLDTPYRPGGWTVRQVVHHLPDSHVNSYCRFKLTMTEVHPTIRTYEEGRWGELEDARTAEVGDSLALLVALHRRWTDWLRTLEPSDWSRTLEHPEVGTMNLDQLLAMYAWHGPHHVAHITRLREREGW